MNEFMTIFAETAVSAVIGAILGWHLRGREVVTEYVQSPVVQHRHLHVHVFGKRKRKK